MAYAQSTLGNLEEEFRRASYQQTKQHFNALEHTTNVLEASRALAARVETMVHRFTGPYPVSAGTGTEPPSGPGILQQLFRASEDAASDLRRANEALDLLEKELA